MKECTVDDWAANTRRLSFNRVHVHATLVTLVEDLFPKNEASILEVGAQTGIDAECLADLQYDVTAVDYNAEAMKLLQLRRKINSVRADGFALPCSDRSFDLVYSQGLIEHFSDTDVNRLVQEQVRVSRMYVIIDVPNTYSLNTIPKQMLIALGKWIVPWETQYTYGELREVGQRNGLMLGREYVWGYDKYIGERLERVMRMLSGTRFGVIEKKFGRYFQKCIGAVFEK